MSAVVPDRSEGRRLAEIEAEHAEQLARSHAALAAAQDRLYWLDRWGIDLNELMRRRGAGELRLVLRALRALSRAGIEAKRGATLLPGRIRAARTKR